MATMNGTIKRITEKGFGFIATAEGTEYFFHQSACARTSFDDLREGQAVSDGAAALAAAAAASMAANIACASPAGSRSSSKGR